MYRSRVKIERVSEQLDPDPTRVIPRFFGPGDEKRLRGIIERIRALDRSEVSENGCVESSNGFERSTAPKSPNW